MVPSNRMRSLALLLVCACGPERTPVSPTPDPAKTVVTAGSSECKDPYVASPEWSGKKPSLPPVPTLPDQPRMIGDAYTVFGAIRGLHDYDPKDVTAKDIAIVGYIVDTNLPRVDKCAIHKAGKADPENCVTEVPTFTIADENTPSAAQKIRVMGWASNFAQVYTAMLEYQKPNAQPYQDALWAIDVPKPLPAVGAKVKVTGRYAVNFTKSSAGMAADPRSGLLTYGKMEYLEQAPRPATFPQLGAK